MFTRLIARLLHYANSSPPWNRREFYDLKDGLLRKYATYAGDQIQEIRKPCWGPSEWDHEYGDYNYKGCGPKCPRCGGTGIFDIRWVRLRVFNWHQFTFHIPDGDTRKPPDHTPDILGRIEHRDYGDLAREACLWLYLLCGEWQLFWNQCTGWRVGWYWWPLLNVQRIISTFRMWFHVRRCWCGKRFITWGSGWHVCKACRNSKEVPDEIPF